MMKKILFAMIIGALLCSGCEGILDRQIPVHNTVDGNVVTDQASAEVALIGAYSHLAQSRWEFYYITTFGNLAGTMWSKYRAAQSSATTGVGYDYDQIDNTLQYDDSYIVGDWKAVYNMILSANWVIDRVEQVSDNRFTGNRKNEILAEARFIRFFGHYYIFRLFARFWDVNSTEGILYRDAPVSISNQLVARLNVSDSYDRLLEDLDYVIENGPDFTDAYHASKDAARAFKAELLMMRGSEADYQEVISLADAVLPRFTLESSLPSLFSKGATSSEVIFARFQSLSDTWATPVMRTFSLNVNYFVPELILNYIEPGSAYDNLYQGETIYYDPQGNPSTYHNTLVKMAPTGKTVEDVKQSTKVFYMRAAELHLLKAEAIARRSGDASQVRNIINTHIYSRANYPAIPAVSFSKAELLEEVYKAYLLEIGLENGIEFPLALRFFDASTNTRKIIRQKRNLESEADMWRVILPIPQEEMRVNSLMVQNEKYPEK